MASQKNLDKKHDTILRGLLKLPANRRCADCETLGPQYVVTDFNTFVCTICSGVHRQYNHRCKGISVSSFKPEEIKKLQEGGNGVAAAKFLARWTPEACPRPKDRTPDKIRAWIDMVYVKKAYFSDLPAGAAVVQQPQHQAVDDIPSQPLSDFLGGANIRLEVSPKATGAGASAFPVMVSQTSSPAPGGGAADLLGAAFSTPALPSANGAGPAPQPPAWDAFSALSDRAEPPSYAASAPPVSPGPSAAPPAATAPSAQPPAAPKAQRRPASAASLDPGAGAGQWEAFDAPKASSAGAGATGAGAPPAGWQAFGDADGTGKEAAPPGAAPVGASAAQERGKPAEVAQSKAVMRELPSDLFTEFVPAPSMAYAGVPPQYTQLQQQQQRQASGLYGAGQPQQFYYQPGHAPSSQQPQGSSAQYGMPAPAYSGQLQGPAGGYTAPQGGYGTQQAGHTGIFRSTSGISNASSYSGGYTPTVQQQQQQQHLPYQPVPGWQAQTLMHQQPHSYGSSAANGLQGPAGDLGLAANGPGSPAFGSGAAGIAPQLAGLSLGPEADAPPDPFSGLVIPGFKASLQPSSSFSASAPSSAAAAAAAPQSQGPFGAPRVQAQAPPAGPYGGSAPGLRAKSRSSGNPFA